MKDHLRKALRMFLLAVAVILVVLFVVGIVLIFDWPWWVSIYLLLLIAGVVVGAFFLRRIWLRRREQNFVNEISEQDMAAAKAMSSKDKNDIKALSDRWKSAIETLRKSHLKKLGNPLYVLPWYMVIGESGSGKTTALNSARLPSPLGDATRRVKGISGTKQCDWWFFEQSVVIDTAGRYAIPVNEGQDKEEWQKFLSLLLKYRRREPLNGVILTIAADRLLHGSHEQLVQDGNIIRRRIDELMRALGVKVPIYLLVTKCDLVQGINRFCQNLPEKSLDQPMGIINQDLSPDVEGFLNRALGTIDERLRNLRLHLLHQPEAKGPEPGLLLFPEEFESLKQGLTIFMTSAFKENPYQETPLLRGLFFSSGRQAGNPHSVFSRTIGVGQTDEALPGTDKGLFLHDFFARILPKDRSLLTPTRKYIEWRMLTNNLGLTSWVILVFALCGLLSFSFVKNMKTIRDFSNVTSRSAALSGDIASDLIDMEQFRREILKVEEGNHHWWIPRFGLNESIEIEQRLKERFCAQFEKSILAPMDRQLAGAISSVSSSTPDDVYGQHVIHIVRRINLLKTRLNEKDLTVLEAKPQPSYVPLLNTVNSVVASETRKVFGALYLSYLLWKSDNGEVAKEIDIMQARLKQLIAVKSGNLQWLAVWVDRQSGLPEITLKDFWGGTPSGTVEKTVNPSSTRKGRDMLYAMLGELESAMVEGGNTLLSQKAAFAAWHRNASTDAWYAFAAAFPNGVGRLHTASEWQAMAVRMASDRNPYIDLFDRLSQELESPRISASLPNWLQQIYRLQSARAQGIIQGKAGERGAGILSGLRKTAGREAQAQQLEMQMITARSWQEYRSALYAIAPAAKSRAQAFQICSQAFAEDPVTGRSPVVLAYNATGRIKSSVAGAAVDPVFSQLVSGPFQFLWSYLLKESAAQLQTQWEEQVLAAIAGMPPAQAVPAMLGSDGLAWRFVKGPAAPFLVRNVSGYRAKEVLGGKMPLDGNLFNFMAKGARTQAAIAEMGRNRTYNVGIRAFPTDANVDAAVKPHGTRLELQCGSNSQILVNNNYPVGKTFNWSADACGDVIFQIEVGDKVLSKHYMGQEGFSDFLKDMRGGRRTFSASEFPDEKSALDRMGIKTITVNYQITGGAPILQKVATFSGQAPRSIAQCWTR